MKRQPKFLAQFASGAFAICKDHCIGISPDNVVVKKNLPDFDLLKRLVLSVKLWLSTRIKMMRSLTRNL